MISQLDEEALNKECKYVGRETKLSKEINAAERVVQWLIEGRAASAISVSLVDAF